MVDRQGRATEAEPEKSTEKSTEKRIKKRIKKGAGVH